MSDRTCLHCVHMELDYEADWSDITPGEGLTCKCNKGHWNLYDWDGDHGFKRKNFRESIQAAPDCPDFEEEPPPPPPSGLAKQAALNLEEWEKARGWKGKIQ